MLSHGGRTIINLIVCLCKQQQYIGIAKDRPVDSGSLAFNIGNRQIHTAPLGRLNALCITGTLLVVVEPTVVGAGDGQTLVLWVERACIARGQVGIGRSGTLRAGNNAQSMTPANVTARVGNEAHFEEHIAIARIAAIDFIVENLLEISVQRTVFQCYEL